MAPATAIKSVKNWNGFTALRLIEKKDSPARLFNRRSALLGLRIMSELNAILDACKKGGLDPFEIAGEIDMTAPDIQRAASGKKRFFHSLRATIKASIEQHGLKGIVDVVARGQRLFIVGHTDGHTDGNAAAA